MKEEDGKFKPHEQRCVQICFNRNPKLNIIQKWKTNLWLQCIVISHMESKRSTFKIRRTMAALLKLTHQKLKLECISGSAIKFQTYFIKRGSSPPLNDFILFFLLFDVQRMQLDLKQKNVRNHVLLPRLTYTRDSIKQADMCSLWVKQWKRRIKHPKSGFSDSINGREEASTQKPAFLIYTTMLNPHNLQKKNDIAVHFSINWGKEKKERKKEINLASN